MLSTDLDNLADYARRAAPGDPAAEILAANLDAAASQARFMERLFIAPAARLVDVPIGGNLVAFPERTKP